MQKVAQKSRESQQQRLKVKELSQQMINLAVQGAGLSPWEARVLVESIEEVYFSEQQLRQVFPGQMKYCCLSVGEPPGKKLQDCQMVTVLLTLLDKQDQQDLNHDNKQASITIRQRRLMRITDEAYQQGGLLTQEDLCQLLMCDVRTIRRDIKFLRKDGIIVPTRGQVGDIGPGVTHRGVAVRLWLEGKEPVEIAQHIHHNLKSVENYLEKFKRVAYLRGKAFDDFQIALVTGISVTAAKTYVELYKEFSHKSFFKSRMQEIDQVGKQHYIAADEKKDSILPNGSFSEGRNK